MRAKTLWIAALFLLTGATPFRIVEGPSHLPHVARSMLRAEYWIQRAPDPDRVIVSAAATEALRDRWRREGLLQDLNGFPDLVSAPQLLAWLAENDSYLERVARYNRRGERIGPAVFAELKRNVNRSAVQGSKKTRWGLTIRRTSLRLVPAFLLATTRPLDLEFNVLMHSGLRLAEPVAVLHASRDGHWLYVASEPGLGWVPARDVALAADRRSLDEYRARATAVVVAAEIFFVLPDGSRWEQSARMGCRLRPAGNETWWLPARSADGALNFVRARPLQPEAIAPMPLPCTRRMLLTQAFRLLGKPYGWGGTSGFGDCSETIRRIGLACGLDLPRSTTAVRRALREVPLGKSVRDKQRKLAELPAGSSLLYMPGHIMLMIGREGNRTYVLHNLYGIQAQDQDGDFVRRVARVVVSDLSLGTGSRPGSLLERVESGLILEP